MEDNVAWKRVLLMGETDDDGGQLYALRHHLQAQKYKLNQVGLMHWPSKTAA